MSRERRKWREKEEEREDGREERQKIRQTERGREEERDRKISLLCGPHQQCGLNIDGGSMKNGEAAEESH